MNDISFIQKWLVKISVKTWAVSGTSHWDDSGNITTIHTIGYQIPTSAKWWGCVWPVCCYYQALPRWVSVSRESHSVCKQNLFGPFEILTDPPAAVSQLFPFSHRGTVFIPSITHLCAEMWADVARMAICSSGCVPEVGDCSLFSAPEGGVTATWHKEVWLGHMRYSNDVWLMDKPCFPWKGNNNWTMQAIVLCPCSPQGTGREDMVADF